MLRVMPETGGRGTGSFAMCAVVADAIALLHHKANVSGEPDALRGASPVRREVVGNVRK